MSHRVVFDTMIFFQWAALPEGRQHGTVKVLYEGTIRLCLSHALLAEVQDLLARPNIRAKSPSLTDVRVSALLAETLARGDWFDGVPAKFTIPDHPDDDHIFDLAIEAQARFIVTWERRLLAVDAPTSPDGARLRLLVPAIRILMPPDFLRELRRLEATGL